MTPFGIRLDHCLVGELVVLPDQLVGAVVLVRDGGASPGDRGYVPVIVVRIGISTHRCHCSGMWLVRLGDNQHIR